MSLRGPIREGNQAGGGKREDKKGKKRKRGKKNPGGGAGGAQPEGGAWVRRRFEDGLHQRLMGLRKNLGGLGFGGGI